MFLQNKPVRTPGLIYVFFRTPSSILLFVWKGKGGFHSRVSINSKEWARQQEPRAWNDAKLDVRAGQSWPELFPLSISLQLGDATNAFLFETFRKLLSVVSYIWWSLSWFFAQIDYVIHEENNILVFFTPKYCERYWNNLLMNNVNIIPSMSKWYKFISLYVAVRHLLCFCSLIPLQ